MFLTIKYPEEKKRKNAINMGIYIRKTTPEERAAYMREYRAKNKERIKAINKKWRENNKEFIKLKKSL